MKTLAAVLCLLASPALAGLCAERDLVIARLKATHGEVRQYAGLQRNARVMETYANAETGSWTIIVVAPSGLACIVAAGEAFQPEPEVGPAKGEPS